MSLSSSSTGSLRSNPALPSSASGTGTFRSKVASELAICAGVLFVLVNLQPAGRINTNGNPIVVAAERPAKTRKTWRGKTSSERAARRPTRVQRDAKKRSALSTEKRKKMRPDTSVHVPHSAMQTHAKQKQAKNTMR